MSLETLLEAAEFLESRGGGDQSKKSFAGVDRHSLGQHEFVSLHRDIESAIGDDGRFKEPKVKTKSGKLSPIYVGPPDSFFMRAGTREVHNKLEKNRKTKGKEFAPYASSTHNWLEKNRRAHLKECFDFLKKNIPFLEDKRTSNLGILRSSLRYIQKLKRKEHEYESEMQKFAREKILLQERMQGLMGDIDKMDIEVDLNMWFNSQQQDNETNSTSTATERGTPPPSDHDENDDDEEEAEKLVMEANPSPTPKSAANKKMASIKELLGNGTSSKVADAVQGLISAQDLLNHVRPSLPQSLPKFISAAAINNTRPNGLVARSVPSQIFKTPAAKKTIPITLSLSGPVQQGATAVIGRIPQTVGTTSAVIGQGEQSVQMSAQVTAKLARPVENVSGIGTLNPSNKSTILIGQRDGPVPTSAARLSWTPQAGVQLENKPAVGQVTSQAGRTPVTQILHRTLTQRQALLKQSQAGSHVTAAPLTVAQLKSPPLSQPSSVTMTTVTGSNIKDTNIPTPVLQLMSSNAASITPNKAGTSAVTVPLTVPYYVASLPKVAHPILVTSLMGPNLVTTSGTSAASFPLTTTAVQKANVTIPASSAALSTVGMLASPIAVSATTRPDAVPMSSGIPVRPVFTPNLLGGQLAWPFLTAIPRSVVLPTSTVMPTSTVLPTSTVMPTSTVTSATDITVKTPLVSSVATSSQVASIPIGSLPQLNQLTQLMTVMSPGVQVAPVGLTQQQLMASPLLKQLQFPLGIQSAMMTPGQVLGGQVVKPVVVVTVPNVVAQTTAPTTVTMVTSSI